MAGLIQRAGRGAGGVEADDREAGRLYPQPPRVGLHPKQVAEHDAHRTTVRHNKDVRLAAREHDVVKEGTYPLREGAERLAIRREVGPRVVAPLLEVLGVRGQDLGVGAALPLTIGDLAQVAAILDLQVRMAYQEAGWLGS